MMPAMAPPDMPELGELGLMEVSLVDAAPAEAEVEPVFELPDEDFVALFNAPEVVEVVGDEDVADEEVDVVASSVLVEKGVGSTD